MNLHVQLKKKKKQLKEALNKKLMKHIAAVTQCRFAKKCFYCSYGFVVTLCLIVVALLKYLSLPGFIIDVMLVTNIVFSVGIILITIFLKNPKALSFIPMIFLSAGLFQLIIYILISSRILFVGEAGQIIAWFSNLIGEKNYTVGLVIMLFLMVIQFIVINKGTCRVAEIAARFTLDTMPAKQMSIDCDLGSGLINIAQAQQRRRLLSLEMGFFSAIDGVNILMRKEATFGIILMLGCIIGGFSLSVFYRGMDLTAAFHMYAILAIGASVFVQIPSLLVSTAGGLIVTQAVKLKPDLFRRCE